MNNVETLARFLCVLKPLSKVFGGMDCVNMLRLLAFFIIAALVLRKLIIVDEGKGEMPSTETMKAFYSWNKF